MFIVRLLYVSSISSAFEEKDLIDILDKAKLNNKRSSITGILYFNRKYFLQCLEGTREEVNATFHRILNDSRHEKIEILQYQEVSSRAFSKWNMGFLPFTEKTKETILKYSSTDLFNPYEMSGDSAINLMTELKNIIPVS